MAEPTDSTPEDWFLYQSQMVWSELEPQIHPFAQVLCITGELYRQLTEEGKKFVATKFQETVQEEVLFAIDGNGPDKVYLGAPRHFVATGCALLRPCGNDIYWIRTSTEARVMIATVIAPEPSRHVRIPRPPNAYILYRKERHHHVKKANPGITNNEISQVLGRAWNMETSEVRQKYKEMSLRIKQALLEKHPDYQYRPRRPSEKKRRRRNVQNDGSTATASSASPGADSTIAASPTAGDIIV
ncbi:MAT1-2-1 [Drechmeria coniospora]|nr:MAT1-2-1 [Drechmeria coniospora]